MKEDRIDRIIRKTYNSDIEQGPSPEFTERVMKEMGVRRSGSKLETKPLRSKRGLLLTGLIYLFIFALVVVLPMVLPEAMAGGTVYQLPEFNLPPLTELLNLDQGMTRILMVLILGGWALIFFDNYIRKLFMR